jgi:hypothetical protein
MVQEWNGSWVHTSEFEAKQPQLEPKPTTADPQGLRYAHPDRIEPPVIVVLTLNPFSTTKYAGSTYINVYSEDHGRSTGNIVRFRGPPQVNIVGTPSREDSFDLVPSFDNAARAIITAQAKADRMSSKTGAIIAQSIQQHIDACAVANVPRDLQGVNAIGKGIRECQAFIDAVAIGTFEKKTITEYAQGAMRAYFHNVPFSQGLKNDPSMVLPGGKAKAAKAGSVTTTNNDALVKTLVKALEQCRTIGNDATAAGIVDLIVEIKPDFTEHVAE